MGHFFISYARDDDEPFVKQLDHDLSGKGFDIWWDRESMESRGRTFLQELRDTIATSDRVIAVIGPKARESVYVRSEWEHALLFSKAVVPILRLGSYELVPPELSKLHCPDFRDERPYAEALAELVKILKQPVPRLGPFRTTVPSLPPHFLPRREEMTHLAQKVLADVQSPNVITSSKRMTAIWGMGGVGKSVMAIAFARATDTRRVFEDGIVWLTFGDQRISEEVSVLANMRLLGLAFNDNPMYYTDPVAAQARLPGLLDEKSCLIVLDDVWSVAQAEPFINAAGPRTRLLVTTREGSLSTTFGAQEHRLDVLSRDSALDLMADWCEAQPETLPGEAVDVANECGNLPFALALCGALVRDGTPWSDLLGALHDADLSFIQTQLPNYPYPNLLRSLKVSLDILASSDAAGAQCFTELAVFCFDKTIPEAAVTTLWKHMNKLDSRRVRKLLATLERKALLKLEGETPYRRITLHDLQKDYLSAQNSDKVSLHNSLLEAYAHETPHGWTAGPADGYYFQRLPHHLKWAQRDYELSRLLTDFSWLESKLGATDIGAMIADYDLLPTADYLRLIRDALRLSAPALSRDPSLLAGQLLGRLLSTPSEQVSSMLKQASEYRGRAWLRPITSSLTCPGGPLVATFHGHPDGCVAVAFGSDATVVNCGCADGGVIRWQVGGSSMKSFPGSGQQIRTVAFSPDGGRLLTTYSDGTVTLRDLDDGNSVRTLSRRDSPAEAAAFADDGQRILIGYRDGSLELARLSGESAETLLKAAAEHDDDEDSGPKSHALRQLEEGLELTKLLKLRHVWEHSITGLGGHLRIQSSQTPTAIGWSTDGYHALSGHWDGALRLWQIDAEPTFQQLHGHTAPIEVVAFRPDGAAALTGDLAGELRLWELSKEESVRLHSPSAEGIYSLAFFPEGNYALSGHSNGDLVLWAMDGLQGRIISHCTTGITSLVVSGDGTRVLSGHVDGDVLVWDLQKLVTLSQPYQASSVDVASITPDGAYALLVDADGTHELVDISEGNSRRFAYKRAHAKAAGLSHDGKRALCGYFDGTLLLWDMDTGKASELPKQHEIWVTSVAVNSSCFMALSGDVQGKLILWTLHNNNGHVIIDGGMPVITTLAMSADGEKGITGFRDSPIAILWNIGKPSKLPVHDDGITAAVISLDGQNALTGDKTGTLLYWELATGQSRRICTDMGSIDALAMSEGGRFALCASVDLSLAILELESGKTIASFIGDSLPKACALREQGPTAFVVEQTGKIHILRLETGTGSQHSVGSGKGR